MCHTSCGPVPNINQFPTRRRLCHTSSGPVPNINQFPTRRRLCPTSCGPVLNTNQDNNTGGDLNPSSRDSALNTNQSTSTRRQLCPTSCGAGSHISQSISAGRRLCPPSCGAGSHISQSISAGRRLCPTSCGAGSHISQSTSTRRQLCPTSCGAGSNISQSISTGRKLCPTSCGAGSNISQSISTGTQRCHSTVGSAANVGQSINTGKELRHNRCVPGPITNPSVDKSVSPSTVSSLRHPADKLQQPLNLRSDYPAAHRDCTRQRTVSGVQAPLADKARTEAIAFQTTESNVRAFNFTDGAHLLTESKICQSTNDDIVQGKLESLQRLSQLPAADRSQSMDGCEANKHTQHKPHHTKGKRGLRPKREANVLDLTHSKGQRLAEKLNIVTKQKRIGHPGRTAVTKCTGEENLHKRTGSRHNPQAILYAGTTDNRCQSARYNIPAVSTENTQTASEDRCIRPEKRQSVVQQREDENLRASTTQIFNSVRNGVNGYCTNQAFTPTRSVDTNVNHGSSRQAEQSANVPPTQTGVPPPVLRDNQHQEHGQLSEQWGQRPSHHRGYGTSRDRDGKAVRDSSSLAQCTDIAHVTATRRPWRHAGGRGGRPSEGTNYNKTRRQGLPDGRLTLSDDTEHPQHHTYPRRKYQQPPPETNYKGKKSGSTQTHPSVCGPAPDRSVQTSQPPFRRRQSKSASEHTSPSRDPQTDTGRPHPQGCPPPGHSGKTPSTHHVILVKQESLRKLVSPEAKDNLSRNQTTTSESLSRERGDRSDVGVVKSVNWQAEVSVETGEQGLYQTGRVRSTGSPGPRDRWG